MGDTEYVSSHVSINEHDGPFGAPPSAGRRLLTYLRTADLKVPLYAIGLLLASTGNSVLFKKMTNKMYNYPYFLSQLTTFVYLPIFGLIVLWELKFTNFITPEMREFPKRKYLTMGVFDALSGIFMLFGGIHTSGSFQALLLNAVIPFTMFLSIVFLNTKYLRTQYAGALIIMAGVAVVLVPSVVNGDNSDNNALFNLIFLLAPLPQAFSSIYKESAFGDINLDVNLLQFWVAVFQFLIGLVLVPLNALPFLQDAYVPFSELPYTIANGARCMAGINSKVNETVWDQHGMAHGSCWLDKQNKWGAPTDEHCDDCTGAWLPIMGYIMFNCAYNLFIMLVIKHGGASLLWIILTLRLPLVQIAFAIPALNNPPDDFKVTAIIGLFVILLGLILYRYSSIVGSAEAEEEEDIGEALADDADLTAAGLMHSDSFGHVQRLTHPSESY